MASFQGVTLFQGVVLIARGDLILGGGRGVVINTCTTRRTSKCLGSIKIFTPQQGDLPQQVTGSELVADLLRRKRGGGVEGVVPIVSVIGLNCEFNKRY